MDWSTGSNNVVDAIAGAVRSEVDVFQLDNVMRPYTFGPIITDGLSTFDPEIDESQSQNATSALTMRVSDGSTVQIDNVSLLPVLEVNKQSEPIARSCRAYPENDSRQCDYQERDGSIYRGWKGYCLEQDPADSSRCITWYPLENLSGERSIVSRQSAGYQGRDAVYHCAVARGLERPGFCDTTSWNAGATFNGASGGFRRRCVVCAR